MKKEQERKNPIVNKYKMGIQFKQMQSENERKNRIGRDECGKIIKNRRLTVKEIVKTKMKEKVITFRTKIQNVKLA